MSAAELIIIIISSIRRPQLVINVINIVDGTGRGKERGALVVQLLSKLCVRGDNFNLCDEAQLHIQYACHSGAQL